MQKLKQILSKLQKDFYTVIPEETWEQMYKELQNEVIKYGKNRYTTLIVSKSYSHISITTLQHELVVDIPQVISSIDQVNFTDFFNALSHKKQNAIKKIIQKAIKKEEK